MRWAGRNNAAALTPPVVAALEPIAREHPEDRTREWALTALGRAPHSDAAAFPSPALTEAAARGSRAAVRALITRAEDPYTATRDRIAAADDPIRRAAYEVLAAPSTLPFEVTPERAAEITDLALRHLSARPEDPFVFLRTVRHFAPAGRAALRDRAANDAALVRTLRPYAISAGPEKKPWWDALLAVADLDTPEARALIAEATAAVPTAAGRAIMRERLGLPPDPNDPIPDEEPKEPRFGGGGGH